MVIAEQAEEIRASAFAPAHIGAVIDEAGKIGVFKIDPNGKRVRATAVFVRDATGEVGPVVGSVGRGGICHGARFGRADVVRQEVRVAETWILALDQ